jgi:hypothetical protein
MNLVNKQGKDILIWIVLVAIVIAIYYLAFKYGPSTLCPPGTEPYEEGRYGEFTGCR